MDPELIQNENEAKSSKKLDAPSKTKSAYFKILLKALNEPLLRQVLSMVFLIIAYAEYHVADPSDAWYIAFYLVIATCLAFDATKKVALIAVCLAILYAVLSFIFIIFREQSALVAIVLGVICILYAVKK